MAKDTFKMIQVDLSTARDGFAVPVGGARRIVVWSGDTDALLRIDGPSADQISAKEGGELCDPAGIDTVFVDHPGGGGTLELLTVHGDALAELGSAGKDLPSPERLSGDLAAGTTIADGADAAENIDTSDASSLRVRARVSGTASLAQASMFEGGDPGGVAVDQERGLVYLADGGDIGATIPTLRVFNIEGPDNLTQQGSVQLSADNRDRLGSIAYDEADQLVVYTLTDDSAGTTHVGTVDVADPAAPVDNGNVQVGAFLGDVVGQVALDETADLAVVAVPKPGDLGNSVLALVDYSNPAAPSNPDSITGRVEAVVLNPDGNVGWANLGADVVLFQYTALGLGEIDRDDINDAKGASWDVDRDLGIVFATVNSASEIRGYDYTSTGALALLFTESFGNSGFTVVVDPDRKLLYRESGGTDLVMHTYDVTGLSGALDTLEFAELLTAGAGVFLASGVVYTVQDGDNSLNRLDTFPGSDRLVIRPLLTDGTPSELGKAVEVSLLDRVPVLVDLDLGGEDRVEVRVQARSGVQTTVDFVEQYRR